MFITVGLYTALNCPAITDILRAHFSTSFPEISHFFGYSTVLVITARFFNIIATFVWNFMDMLIIILSIGISNRFKQLNKILQQSSGKLLTAQFWDEHRIYHREICFLTEKVNKRIAFIVIISITNNLFFICVQLLNSLA